MPNPHDIPFALLYLACDNEPDKFRLVAQVRVSSGAPLLLDDIAGDVQTLRDIPVPSGLVFASEITHAPTQAVMIPLHSTTGMGSTASHKAAAGTYN